MQLDYMYLIKILIILLKFKNIILGHLKLVFYTQNDFSKCNVLDKN